MITCQPEVDGELRGGVGSGYVVVLDHRAGVDQDVFGGTPFRMREQALDAEPTGVVQQLRRLGDILAYASAPYPSPRRTDAKGLLKFQIGAANCAAVIERKTLVVKRRDRVRDEAVLQTETIEIVLRGKPVIRIEIALPP